MKERKHAYLIMAHNDFYILEKLLELLDDANNDIFIHIDKKVKNFDFDKYKNIVNKGNLYYVKRTDVRWGGYSQINCELLLLKAATSHGKYVYYHSLSGVDMPLHSQKYIHDFFEKNKGKEFIHFCEYSPINGKPKFDRVKYYHVFNKNLRSSNPTKVKLSKKLYYNFLRLQRVLKIHRHKNKTYMHGASWFSITDDFARFIISKEKEIKKEYRHSFCADEVFLQTLVYRYGYDNNLYLKKDDDYMQNVRHIDWKRGEPYTFKTEDYDELINSKCLFARKFSTKVDKKIVDLLYDNLRSQK